MAKLNTYYPFQATDYTFTTRTIQSSGATTGCVYVFICPADFASAAIFNINIAISTNGNSGSQNVAARLYDLDGSGNWASASPLSAQANLANNTTNFPAAGVAEMSLTLTSALTKGVRYALRIFANTTFSAGLGINVTFGSNNPYLGNVDEYHINAVTISTGTPNLAIGTATTWIGNKCTRRVAQNTTATTAVTSQVGFRFSLPTGLNYTLNNVVLKGLTLDINGNTGGNYTGRILDAAGTTTIASTPAVSHANIRAITSAVSNFTFSFTTNPSLTGGTGYIFVVESALEKQLQYFEIQSETDTSQTFNGEVGSMEVVSRNSTSGVFTSFNTLGPPSYRAMAMAQFDVTPVGSAGAGGMVVHPGMKGGING